MIVRNSMLAEVLGHRSRLGNVFIRALSAGRNQDCLFSALLLLLLPEGDRPVHSALEQRRQGAAAAGCPQAFPVAEVAKLALADAVRH